MIFSLSLPCSRPVENGRVLAFPPLNVSDRDITSRLRSMQYVPNYINIILYKHYRLKHK